MKIIFILQTERSALKEWWNLSTIFLAEKLPNDLFIYLWKCIGLTGK